MPAVDPADQGFRLVVEPCPRDESLSGVERPLSWLAFIAAAEQVGVRSSRAEVLGDGVLQERTADAATLLFVLELPPAISCSLGAAAELGRLPVV